MNYYPHHIGDFNNATRHLTRIERSIYRDLIELYYDTEKPLPLDIPKITRLVCANNPEETQSVISVIDEFFEKTSKGYVNKRCDLEINNYLHRVEVNRTNGKQGGRPIGTTKKTHSVNLANPNESENNPNQEPRTKNQEPNTEEPKGSMSSPVARTNGIPYEKIKDLYNQLLPKNHRCIELTTKRKGQIGARWNAGSLPNLEEWEKFFVHVGKSQFLTGQCDPGEGKRRFIADLEWLTKESNYTKILEGKYHGTR